MASSKVMPSTSNSTNSDLNSLSSHHHHHNHNLLLHNRNLNQFVQSQTQMIPDFDPNISNNVDGILRDVVYGDNLQESAIINHNNNSASLFDTDITLIDAAGAISAIGEHDDGSASRRGGRKTAEEVWREIINGKTERKECKVEAVDEMMTLEDFLAKAGAEIEGEEVEVEEEDVKVEVEASGVQMSEGGGLFGFDHGLYAPQPIATAMGGVMGYGGGGGGGGNGGMEGLGGGGGGGGGVRGKRRGGPILEPLDKAAQQRQRRMIKNRESAARSRERKQAYQVELESLALKLEEENEQLLREKAERTKKRLQQLMEKVVPVVEKRRPPRVLRRVSSMP